MCGIFGLYAYHAPRTRRAALNTLLNGLRQLEYRGYDSAGVCIDGVAKQLVIAKATGKVDVLAELANARVNNDTVCPGDEVLDTQAAIGHTRWATHGRPAAINSHPHTSGDDNEWVVVHNGIITNYQALKDFLISQGETFVTQTDTEVVPKLCKVVYNRLHKLDMQVTFTQVLMEVVSQLEGAFALLIRSTRFPDELMAAKKGSPLLVGLVEQSALMGRTRSELLSDVNEDTRPFKRQAHNGFEAYFSSDAAALVEHTRRVISLEDNDVLHMVKGDYAIFNMAQPDREQAVERVHQILEMEVASIMKGAYDHFMQKEIHEQPESLAQTLMGRIKPKKARAFQSPRSVAGYNGSGSASDSECSDSGMSSNSDSPNNLLGTKAVDPFPGAVRLGGVMDHLDAIRRCRRVLFVGCGTSYHACMACRQTIEQLTNMPVTLELASDLLDRQAPIFRDDMCVFVSQSGETADTLQALKYAKQQGALCVGVTNTVGSAIATTTDCGIHVNAGCEIGVASTKAYTSQIVAITLLALVLAEDSVSRKGKYNAVVSALRHLPDSVRKTLKLDGKMRELAASLKDEPSMLVFGRGQNYATALETALKIKEVALIHSEGVLAGEMKHGTLALVDETLPILVVATQDSGTYRKMASVIEQLRARDARLIVMVNEGDPLLTSPGAKGCKFIEVPKVEESVQPVVNIVPLQLLSYHLTCLRGFNVDQPRNLAKSVTVTEE